MALSMKQISFFSRMSLQTHYASRTFATASRFFAKPGYFFNKFLKPHKHVSIQEDTHGSPLKIKNLIPETTRRQRVLNTVFTDYVTEILTAGSFGSVLSGSRIEITQVRVTYDISKLNVYWTITDSTVEEDEKAAKLLAQCASPLRTQLLACRAIGMVPKIVFIKDKSLSAQLELEKIFRVIDMGPPLQEDDEALENQQDAMLPEMTSNVFGLDRRKMMDLVKAKMNGLPLNQTVAEEEIPLHRHDYDKSNSKEIISEVSSTQLKEFVRQQKIKRAKAERQQKLDDADFVRRSVVEERIRAAILAETEVMQETEVDDVDDTDADLNVADVSFLRDESLPKDLKRKCNKTSVWLSIGNF